MSGIGTLMNVATVLVGGTLGALLGARFPERVRETIMHGLGLMTLAIGVKLSLESQNVLIVLGSLLLGGIVDVRKTGESYGCRRSSRRY